MPEQGPESQADIESLSDLRTPWALRVAVTLDVPERIAAGTSDLPGLAAACGCDADLLGHVLRHLVGRGVFTEPAPGRFALNAAAEQLRRSDRRLMLDLDGLGGRIAHAWGTLLTVVRTGRPGYAEVFGRPFWEDLDAHPDVGESFDQAMGPAGHGAPDIDVLPGDDWDAVRTIVDVGGGTGSLLAGLLRAHPGLQGTLVDLPRAAGAAAATFREAGVADRVRVVAQSFFDPLPPGADCYLLSSVLNDWPDEEKVAILARCAAAAAAARPPGRVVVRGGVTADDRPGGLVAEIVLLAGRECTLARFRELAGRAGLAVTAAAPNPAGRLVVECRPA